MNNIKFTYSKNKKSKQTFLDINFNDIITLNLFGFTHSELIDLKNLFKSSKSSFDIEYGYDRDEIRYQEISENTGIMEFSNHHGNTITKIKINRESIITSLDELEIIKT